VDALVSNGYETTISNICGLNWDALSREDLDIAAWGYYFFSVQFRENLEIACELHPDDSKLAQLRREECNTANLSPWPGVAEQGEKLNHDEFMRRTIALSVVSDDARTRVETVGAAYLERVRAMDPNVRTLSIASYEDGGLEAVFNAILRAPDWGGRSLAAFRHFLTEHIRFDSDPTQGHGALSRHLTPDDRIWPIWRAFHDLLVDAVPALAT
jgi:hypothetical protein